MALLPIRGNCSGREFHSPTPRRGALPAFQFSREMGLLQGLGLGQGPGGPKAGGLLLAVALLEWHALSPEQWHPPGAAQQCPEDWKTARGGGG